MTTGDPTTAVMLVANMARRSVGSDAAAASVDVKEEAIACCWDAT